MILLFSVDNSFDDAFILQSGRWNINFHVRHVIHEKPIVHFLFVKSNEAWESLLQSCQNKEENEIADS